MDTGSAEIIVSDDVYNGFDGLSSPQLATTETRKVFRLRCLVFLVLFFAAIGVSAGVFRLARKSESEEFNIQFEESATKINSAFQEVVSQKFEAIKAMTITLSAHVRSHPGEEWPFITLNDFQERADSVRKLSGALFLRFAPLVTDATREAWEAYSLRNLDWLSDIPPQLPEYYTRKLQESENTTGYETVVADDVVDFSTGVGSRIYTGSAFGGIVADSSPGPYFPLWQESPTFGVSTSPVNLNIGHYPPYAPHISRAIETGKMTLGGIQTAPRGLPSDEDYSTRYFASLLSVAAKKKVTYMGDPMSTVFVPVFSEYNTTENPVAIMFGVFGWASYFENLLTENFPGIAVVLENTCDGPFTYKIVGTEVEYIGPGDLHLSKFNSMRRRFDLKDESTAEGLNLHQSVCPYSLSVYPAQELFDAYITNLPFLLTTAVLLVFALASGVFFLYNQFVEERQDLVMNQAVQSTAIVSSMFPEAVRDRLMQDQANSHLRSGKKRLKSFLDDGDDKIDMEPIADLFPNATVFICDIAGFTAWSSTRDPSQVFILLQAIYQAFDVIAKRYRVFKVETVGDRYLAVAGCPEKDDRHFVTMSEFAYCCLAKFSQLTKKLEQTLGPDTGDLGLRVGLHRYVADSLPEALLLFLIGPIHSPLDAVDLLQLEFCEESVLGSSCLEILWPPLHGLKSKKRKAPI